MNKLLAILILLFIAGYAPIPHAAKVKPEMRGTILYNGMPAKGAEVRQCRIFQDGKCQTFTAVTTDENGNFKLKARREFRWYVTLFGDEMFGYGFTVYYKGNSYPGCTGNDLGVLSDVSHITYELTSKEECNLHPGG
ncbi:DUF6795 domain-containing protein [Marinimicrobium sp. LS-A18]|uniref:DUF6795 domain-containing protein n=1 Tax=Marinimicrobium sp. LS-A18 TaxID=1381596 RepID=UPI00126943A4|nr:DUF6795 domain-containing protein [Marinimicrobium sp. LS-A18]